jgi:hypothetical protein
MTDGSQRQPTNEQRILEHPTTNTRRRNRGRAKPVYGKYWCFTRNNPTESATDFLRRLQRLQTVKAVIFQLEKAHTGTLHFQGYLETTKSFATTRIAKLLRDGAHFEKRSAKDPQKVSTNYFFKVTLVKATNLIICKIWP